MGKMKKSKKPTHRKSTIMNRSDIPYAERIALQRRSDIRTTRDHSAKIAMYCMSVAMYELENIGYKRLVRFSQRFKRVVDEFYEDPDVGMAHAKHRMNQLGMPISGEFYTVHSVGKSKREVELENHSLQAVQIALLCGAVTMNDEFGFGLERQTRISDRVKELSDRYSKEGEQFLVEKMRDIGFPIVNGTVMAFVDEEGNAVTQSRALKEGYTCG